MTHVYLVVGCTGEYSDHREWTVGAYYSENNAKRHASLAEAEAKELAEKHGTYHKVTNRYDKYMEVDYTGTNYIVSKVQLLDNSPFDEFHDPLTAAE